MFYKHFHPIPALAPYIDCFWIIESSAESAISRKARMPADSRATLLVNFAGASRMIGSEGANHRLGLGANLLGVHSQNYTLEHDGSTDLIAAQFRPGGIAPFMRCAAGELAEQAPPLELLWGRAGNRLCEQIYEAESRAEKLALYQNALLERLAAPPHHPRILHALAQIEQANFSVEALAAQANLSQKQFERVFERTVGMMPKRYIRLARFQKLVHWLTHSGGDVHWTTAAAQFGYYDHSHLAKDFQAFAGTTPSEFAAATAGITEVAYGTA